MSDPVYHIPALLQPCIEGLCINNKGTYVDVTFGGGGHSRAILEHLDPDGQLFSFDCDIDALHNQQGCADSLLCYPNWHFVHGNFRHLTNWLDYYGIDHIDGLIADLGVSFHHFDQAQRGFSFRFTGPLDMRMNNTGGKTAADILNTYAEEDLARVLYLYGEMRNSRPIAHHLCLMRAQESFSRTEQLVQCLCHNARVLDDGTIDVNPADKKDLARLFQALRIEVNDEMGSLNEMLCAAKQALAPGGRIVILTYHSLEDRMVKNFLRSGYTDGHIEKDFYGNIQTPFTLIEKGLTASDEEVTRNPRARSAKLRIAQKK